MKSIIKFFILSIILNSFTWIAPQKVSAQASVSFQNFYDDLSPYGNWIDNSDYGYVWVPNVSPGFIPYSTDGYWLFTDEGWTWVSDYSWGWAPFHYGRWFYDNYQGWLWVPDNEWGPGWVSWRRSEGYYGWAPMSPGFNVAINYNSSNSLPYNEWTFVRNRDFGRRDINKYFVSSSGNSIIYNNSTTINNIRTDRSNNVRYNAGPDRAEVERNAGKSFTPVVIRERNTPGRNQNKNEIQIYRPQVQKNIPDGRRPAPQRVMNWKDLKQTVGQGNSRTIQPQKVNQPDKGLPVQRQRNDQPFKQQPIQQKRSEMPGKLPQHNNQPQKKDQPFQRQRNDQPFKQQPLQQKQNDKPGKQNHSKAQQTNPLKK